MVLLIYEGAKTFPVPTRKHLVNIYLFKFNNRNTRKRSEICAKLTIKTTVFMVKVEHFSHFFLILILFTLDRWMLAGQLNQLVQTKNLVAQSSNRNNKIMCKIWKRLTIKTYQNEVTQVVLVSLFFPLNRFHTLFCCSHC